MASTNSTQPENPKPKKIYRPPTDDKLLIKEDKTEYELQVITPQSSDEPVEGSVETIEAAEEHEKEMNSAGTKQFSVDRKTTRSDH